MHSQECNHILVSDSIDVRAVGGFSSSNAYLLLSDSKQLLFTDFRYASAATDFCRANPPWNFIPVAETGFSFLREHLPGGSVVGIESNTMTLDTYRALRAQLKGVKLKFLGSAVSALAVVKSEEEVKLMRRCARIGEQALHFTLEQLRCGMSERDVKSILEQECLRLGSQKPSFDTIVLFGARSALPHGVPSSRRLVLGDWVLFDFGCMIDGLCSDMTRTVVMGRASEQQRRIYDTVLKAQNAARKNICAGMPASTADAFARDIITQAGYGERFGHATGHGVGYRVHEEPRVSTKNHQPLPVGAVVTVEPGIYIPGFGGVRIEDMVYLKGEQSTLLTRFPRNLIEVG
jgi:Xaa-Pro aminopeptidase